MSGFCEAESLLMAGVRSSGGRSPADAGRALSG